MRMLMNVRLPHSPFNEAVKDGSIARKMEAIIAETKPEAVYYTEMNGRRGAVLIVDLETPSRVPALAEPWFLSFDADVEFHIVMSPGDLKDAKLDQLGERWG